MFKRYVFLIIAAIVVLVGATSCDKDTYEKTDVKFYKFLDDKTIVVYDDELIEVGRRNIEIQLHAQLTFPRPDLVTPLAFAEDEPGERMFSLAGEIYDDAKGDYKTAPNSIDFEFTYVPYGEVSVRLIGANVNNAEEDEVLVCLDPLELKAEIISVKQVQEPFYQKAQVKYRLKTQNSGILVSETVQEFELGIKPEGDDNKTEPEGDGDQTKPEGDGGETEGSES